MEPGQIVTFTVTLANPLPGPLTGAVVTDDLPAGLVYVAGSAWGFVYEPSRQQG